MVAQETARKFTFDVGWVFVSSVVAMGAGLLIRILLGNYFDASGLGAYAMVLTIWGIVTLTTGAGAPGALIKYVAECADDKDTRDSLVSASILNGFIMGLAATILFIIAAPWLESIFNIPDLANLLRIASLSFPFVTLNNVFVSYLNGVRRMKWYAAFEIYRKGIVLVFTMILVWLGMGIPGAVWALVIAPVSVTAAQLVIHKRLFSYTLARYKECTKKLFGFGSKLFAANIIGQINTQAATLLIGFYLLDSDVGVYAVALMFFNLLIMVPLSIQRITYPAISEYFSKQRFQSIKIMVESTMKYSFLYLSLMCLLIFFYVDDIISIIFPGKATFISAVDTIIILVMMTIFYASLIPIGSIFSSIGKPDISMILSIVRFPITVLLSIILIPSNIQFHGIQLNGINGAAIAFGLTEIISAFFVIIFIKKLIPITIQFKSLYIGTITLFCTILFAYASITYLPISSNLLGGIIILIFFVGIFPLGVISRKEIDDFICMLKK